ncbi:MAG: class I SAM-dependent methyltransferase [Chloroflexi bacterium]|nr:MAG: class I SAM-dependent methyltransferase [Chloroflexota bacterium]
MPPPDPSDIVGAGYDRIAGRYLEWSRGSELRVRQLERLLALLPARASVLELGCGAGEPVTRRLSEAHDVTAIDVSAAQLRLAARNAPRARLVQADVLDLDFPRASFEAVVSFYALTHVPRARHAQLLAGIARWLRPGGILFGTLGASDAPGAVDEDWLGVPMYFSHFDAATNRALVEESGLELVEAEVIEEGESDPGAAFLWVLARAPREGDGSR